MGMSAKILPWHTTIIPADALRVSGALTSGTPIGEACQSHCRPRQVFKGKPKHHTRADCISKRPNAKRRGRASSKMPDRS